MPTCFGKTWWRSDGKHLVALNIPPLWGFAGCMPTWLIYLQNSVIYCKSKVTNYIYIYQNIQYLTYCRFVLSVDIQRIVFI